MDEDFNSEYQKYLVQVLEEYNQLFVKNPEPGKHWHAFYDKLEEEVGTELMIRILHDIHRKKREAA